MLNVLYTLDVFLLFIATEREKRDPSNLRALGKLEVVFAHALLNEVLSGGDDASLASLPLLLHHAMVHP